jgi:branched-chain amino acid aminotransferase
MVNNNGNIVAEANLSMDNRAFNYADALFETCKVVAGKVQFWEDHYFRLMASMRMLRMQIPMEFTLEYLEKEVLKLTAQLEGNTFRVKLLVYRDAGGFYTPNTNTVSFLIRANELESDGFLPKEQYRVDLFKDYYTSTDLLATLKTTQKTLNVLAAIYAQENNLDSCLLVNTSKNISEAIAANLFLVKEKMIITPPLSAGCLKGVMRKKIIELIQKEKNFTFIEKDISPFDLLKADELFLTNSIQGIQPITQYRKKLFTTTVSKQLLVSLENLLASI